MISQRPPTIIIIDRARSYGFRLRNSLAQRDVVVHVFHEFNAALTLMQRKKIDTVVLEFNASEETANFCNQAKASNIPVVFASGPVEAHDLRQYGFDPSFQRSMVRPGIL
jgi:DNA-binding response OmpR family regulator